MRVVFCSECSSLLDPPESVDSDVTCVICGATAPHDAFLHKKVTTVLHVNMRAGAEDEEQRGGAGRDKNAERALVDEQCEKCKHPQMYYYTMQLRSADEGQTVFYECPKCQHKFSTNT